MKKFARYLFISAIFFEGLQSLSYGRVNLKRGVMNIDMFGEDFGLKKHIFHTNIIKLKENF